MAADGSHGPRPWKQHKATTTFLRVPYPDWTYVKRGVKTEFRGSKNTTSAMFNASPPLAVVAYTILRADEYDGKLMVLEQCWQEPLGSISPESLRREGFADLAEFRRYWMTRERRRFQPSRVVWVYRVRPWRSSDFEELAFATFTRLYEEWL